jgi:hypothetical protein
MMDGIDLLLPSTNKISSVQSFHAEFHKTSQLLGTSLLLPREQIRVAPHFLREAAELVSFMSQLRCELFNT